MVHLKNSVNSIEWKFADRTCLNRNKPKRHCQNLIWESQESVHVFRSVVTLFLIYAYGVRKK